MIKGRRPSTQTWRTFLRNHAAGIAAMDFLVVPTISFRLLYALVILRHDRRHIVSISVTDHPTAQWIARQIGDAFPWDETPIYLIRDRDAAYGHAVRLRLQAMGIRDRPTAPRSPWQNACAERLVGSIRRECLDHIIVLGEAHLHHILKACASYYNNARTHLSLKEDAPRRAADRTQSLHPQTKRILDDDIHDTEVWLSGCPTFEAVKFCGPAFASTFGFDLKGQQRVASQPPPRDTAALDPSIRTSHSWIIFPKVFSSHGAQVTTVSGRSQA